MLHKAQSALSYIDNSDRNVRLTVAAALHHEYGAEAEYAYYAWAGDDAGERSKWKWAAKARKVTIGSLYQLASKEGWTWDEPDPDAARRAIQKSMERKRELEAEIEAEERRKKQAEESAMKTAVGLWSMSDVPWPHPYLYEKKFSDELAEHCKARRHGKHLLIPAYNIEDAMNGVGEIVDIQRIADGVKKFTYGGSGASGKAMMIDGGHKLSIVEGWATGVARFASTGDSVLVAFNDHNSVRATYEARRVYPNRHITYVMDNDKSGAGQRASEKVGAVVDAIYKPKKVGHDYWNEWASGV